MQQVSVPNENKLCVWGNSCVMLLQGNLHFLKKLPPGVEASNVLIGEVDFLRHHVTAFVRLANATFLPGIVEVTIAVHVDILEHRERR